MKMQTLKDLYIDELKDMYDAENQIVKALPKMAKEATNEELRAAIEQHLDQTQTHIERLEQVFEDLGEKAKGTKCEATKGLIEEAKRMMEEAEDDDVRDAAIIGSAQKVEHYEIASYGTLRTYAELLGFDEQAELLQETYDRYLRILGEDFVDTMRTGKSLAVSLRKMGELDRAYDLTRTLDVRCVRARGLGTSPARVRRGPGG